LGTSDVTKFDYDIHFVGPTSWASCARFALEPPRCIVLNLHKLAVNLVQWSSSESLYYDKTSSGSQPHDRFARMFARMTNRLPGTADIPPRRFLAYSENVSAGIFCTGPFAADLGG
jgi:hypothetical protein